MITTFRGKYIFLSNFYPSKVLLDGDEFESVETAYQAAKTTKENREIFKSLRASEAKRYGKKVKIRPDWENIKVKIMRDLIQQKFTASNSLGKRLLETGDEELVEGNVWGDRFWGVSYGKGENILGKLLMERRDELKDESPTRH